MKKLKLLDASILNNYHNCKKIAVVGNSGLSEHEQDIISSCDRVIRFNNYATRDGIELSRDKYRCDILFSTLDLHSAGASPKDVVIGIPFPFKAKRVSEMMGRWYAASRQWMVNPYINMQMCEEMEIDSLGASHPLPSIGFTCLYHIHDMPVEIHVCGFRWYYNDKTGKMQDHDLSSKKYPTNWNHNYPKEAIWIANNLLKKDNVIFSPECERVLRIVKSKS